MSDKFCCVTWETLHQELAATKKAEIDALIKDKGLPASIFAPVLKVLSSMGNNCPVCKPAGILPGHVPHPLPIGATLLTPEERARIAPQGKIGNEVPNPKVIGKCARCKGTGKVFGGTALCMTCHGKGIITSASTSLNRNQSLSNEKKKQDQVAKSNFEHSDADKETFKEEFERLEKERDTPSDSSESS